MKKNNKIGILISSYGILFVVLILAVILYFSPIKNAVLFIIQNFSDEKVIYQSTLTSTSILLGFTGTLITNIMNARNKISSNDTSSNQKQLIEYFFKYVNPKILINTILTGIISGVFLIFISLSLIILSALNSNIYEEIYVILFIIWSAFLIIFLLYEIQIFNIFIKLLVSKEKEQNPNSPADLNEEIESCMKAIDKKNQK